MPNYSPNKVCPCSTSIKYKKCCAIYHKGAIPKTALLLMKSRYSAFATGDYNYIIKTTHPENSDYTNDIKSWKNSIEYFMKNTDFINLEILDCLEEEDESFVTFKATLSSGDLLEKSRFIKTGRYWLYRDGEFTQQS